MEPASVSAQPPLHRPELPAPVSHTDSTVTFDKDGFQVILDIIDVGDGNYEIAQANALAADDQARAYNSLLEAGRVHGQIDEIREEQLAKERRDHAQDNWFHRGIIALGVLAVLAFQ